MTYKSDIGVMTYGQSAGPHALTSAGGYSYTYDANGNMLQGKNKTLEYDLENRLTKVTELSTSSTFTYDGDGGRVKKTQGTQTTTYIGSLYEVESNGIITKHIFAGSSRVCSLKSDGTASYYHSDHLGSSNVITDSLGNLAQYCEYTPYGRSARNEGADIVKHKFTGKELDSTGLYYYGARYYDPEIGRFITADTIVQAPYDPQSLNRYSYCRNNPINYIDPSGHFWFIAAIIAAVIGAGVGAGVAAATGGDIGKGAIMGAISGALFWGAGQAISGLATALKIQTTAAMTALKTGVHAFTGAASGALGAVATGGDPGFAAATSAISAGVSAWVGGVFPIAGDGLGAFIGSGVQRTAVGAILGGGTALVMGGSFSAGAVMGARTSAIAYAANDTMHKAVEKAGAALASKAEPKPTKDINENSNNNSESTKSRGVNWKTVGCGITEIISGATAIGRAAAISAATGGAGTIASSWLAYSGVMSLGTGVADVMLGIYGQPTTAEMVGDAISNNPITTRVRQFTPEFMP